MKLTIDHDIRTGHIVVHDEDGNEVSRRRTTCNPAAMAQAICDAERIGDIDWPNSQCARPGDGADDAAMIDQDGWATEAGR